MRDLVVAITGASGAIYAVRLLEVLLEAGRTVHVTISPSAAQLLRHELGLHVDLDKFDPSQLVPADCQSRDEKRPQPNVQADSALLTVNSTQDGGEQAPARLVYHHHQDFRAPIASGSFLTEGMIVCPCSMGTLAAIANGFSQNLIHRAAAVHLKERRKLVVVPRETPLESIQLGNMKQLTDAGAIVLPAMPGFYHNPVTIHDMIDFIVGRLCDQLGVPHGLFKRWGC